MHLNGPYVRWLRSNFQTSATINALASRVIEKFTSVGIKLELDAVSFASVHRSSHSSRYQGGAR